MDTCRIVRYVNGTFGSYDDMQLDGRGQSTTYSASVSFFGLIVPLSLLTALLAGYANLRYEQHLAMIYLDIRKATVVRADADADSGPVNADA